MTKTYSEARQEILFKAARDLRKVAASVLDDTVDAGAGISRQTVKWAIDLAARISRQAWEIEESGHEQCVASRIQETNLSKSKDAYSRAIDRFEARVREANGISYAQSVIEWASEPYAGDPRPLSYAR